jgi:hypothetical protein
MGRGAARKAPRQAFNPGAPLELGDLPLQVGVDLGELIEAGEMDFPAGERRWVCFARFQFLPPAKPMNLIWFRAKRSSRQAEGLTLLKPGPRHGGPQTPQGGNGPLNSPGPRFQPPSSILEDGGRKFNEKMLGGKMGQDYFREMISAAPFRESMKRRRLRKGRPRPVRTLTASWTWREAMAETIPARFPSSTSIPFSGVVLGSP